MKKPISGNTLTPAEYLVDARHVGKHFGALKVLDDVSLAVREKHPAAFARVPRGIQRRRDLY
jgi:hypothetical protein